MWHMLRKKQKEPVKCSPTETLPACPCEEQERTRFRPWVGSHRLRQSGPQQETTQMYIWAALRWWSNGEDLELPMLAAQVQSLVRELDPACHKEDRARCNEDPATKA